MVCAYDVQVVFWVLFCCFFFNSPIIIQSCINNYRITFTCSSIKLWFLIFQSRADLPQAPRGSLWVPSIKKIVREILSFGATLPRLYPGDLLDQLNINEIFSVEISSGEIQMEDVTASSSPQTECFPVVNIMHLVQYLTHCLQKCPRSFTVQDLRNLVVLLCRFALDVRFQTVVFDAEMCIAAVLNCYGEMQWPDEVLDTLLCAFPENIHTPSPGEGCFLCTPLPPGNSSFN